MRVVISGGGTGGHIFPALSVAASLTRIQPDTDLLYIGGSTGMETRIVPERGVPFQAVTAKKLRKAFSFSTIGVLVSLFRGYLEARAHLRKFGAEVVIGTGGYVAAAAVLAGVRMGLPTLIVAPDVIPGRTNLLLARWAKRICVAFPETVAHFPKDRTVVTGVPLREGIIAPQEITTAEARCSFAGLRPDSFTVLVIGGSQGARQLNTIILEAGSALLGAGVQVLHQTGTKNIDAVVAAAEAHGLLTGPAEDSARYLPVGFLDERQTPLALRAADIVVCRGGISTLSEIILCGLPSIVVPLPTAYADHQTYNARALVNAGAAFLRPERELTASALVADILQLRDDVKLREQMTADGLALARPDAAAAVAREALSLGNK